MSALTIDRPSLMTGPIGAIAEQRWIFRLADRIDYSLFGLRGSEVPTMSSMRCFVAAAGLVAQVADPPDADALLTLDAMGAATATASGGDRRPGPGRSGVS